MLRSLLAAFLAISSTGLCALADEPKADATDSTVSFARQILPILQRRCQGCHQPAKREGKLDLTTFEGLAAGGKNGPGFVAGQLDAGTLWKNVQGTEPAMPPVGDALTADEQSLVSRWIEQGARDDTPPAAKDTIDPDHPPIYSAPPLITALAFSPDGSKLVVSGYRELLVHKADGSGLEKRLVGQSQRIESIVFSPDGKTIAAVGGSPGRFGEIQFWNAEDFSLRGAIRSGFDTLYGGSYSPDGKLFAFGCADNSARIASASELEEAKRLDHHSDWVFSTAYSRDGKHLITLGRDGSIKLTEAATGSFIDDIGKNYGELKVMARHPKEDWVAIGGDERVPRLYKIFRTQARDPQYTDFNLLRPFEAQPAPISALAFNPEGSLLAVGSNGGEVRVYKTADASRAMTLPGHRGAVFALAFSPDGKRLATGGFDGTVRLFDLETSKTVAEFVPVDVQAPKAVARAGE